jgi:hypothetical protein
VIPDELHELFAAIGSAVWHLQFLEDVLVTYLTMRLRLTSRASKERGYQILAEERQRTLGSLLTEARKADLVHGDVAEGFKALLEERNWLIHRSMNDVNDELYSAEGRNAFLFRVRELADQAIFLKKALVADTVDFCKQHGVDVALAEAQAVDGFRRLKNGSRR